MIVMKFGGSSVAGAEQLGRVADRVLAHRAQQPCVVVSAMGKTTDALFAAAAAARQGDIELALATIAPALGHAEAVSGALLGSADGRALAAIAVARDELHVLLRGVAMLRELTPRTTDTIVSYGERLTSLLLAALLAHRGAPVLPLDARRFLRTDDRFGHARPQRPVIAQLCGELVAPHLRTGSIVVTEGYVGATAEGYTTTLGRGGSDWSAALLGEALGACEVQIWTDVEGVLTADPRLVPEARPIDVLTPAEAAELAAFGAKVLHPSTMQPAVDAGVPITVRNTMRPEGAFTTIDPRSDVAARNGIAALATRGPVTVLTMTSTRMLATSGYLAKLFAAFGALDICIDLVVTAEISVACTVEPDAPVDRLIDALAGLARVEIARDRAIIAAVGEGLRSAPGTVERACRALLPVTPELICFGGNDRNLSFVVHRDEAAAAMRRLHGEFFPVAAAEPAASAAPRSHRPAVRRAPAQGRSFEAAP